MRINPREWFALSRDERIVVLEYAVFESKRRWERQRQGSQ